MTTRNCNFDLNGAKWSEIYVNESYNTLIKLRPALNLTSQPRWLESHLKIHVRNVHEGKKKFECYKCYANFGRITFLKNHIEKVHEARKEAPFVL